MYSFKTLSLLLLTCTNLANATAVNSPRSGVLKRDIQLSCGTELFNQFDAVCVSEDGTKVCASRIDTCCQLPDGKTPYTCPGFGNSHCCGTDEPACGSDATCKDMRGERAVEEAESAVFPSEVPVTAAPQTTINGNPYASGTGERPQLPLATMTAEDNPNATGGASVLGVRMKEEGVFAVIVAVMVLF